MAIGDGVHSWSLPSTLDAAALSEHVPCAIAQVLVKRGIDTPQKLNILLDPPHRLPYDPLRIAGMDTALRRLYSAVNDGERVGESCACYASPNKKVFYDRGGRA